MSSEDNRSHHNEEGPELNDNVKLLSQIHQMDKILSTDSKVTASRPANSEKQILQNLRNYKNLMDPI